MNRIKLFLGFDKLYLKNNYYVIYLFLFKIPELN